MSKTIIPTIGRVVLFVLSADFKREGEIRPATIVRVHGDGPDALVNLSVQMDGPNDQAPGAIPANNSRWVGSVQLDQDGKKPGTYHWMNFQTGQAVRSEAEGDVAARLKALEESVQAINDKQPKTQKADLPTTGTATEH